MKIPLSIRAKEILLVAILTIATIGLLSGFVQLTTIDTPQGHSSTSDFTTEFLYPTNTQYVESNNFSIHTLDNITVNLPKLNEEAKIMISSHPSCSTPRNKKSGSITYGVSIFDVNEMKEIDIYHKK